MLVGGAMRPDILVLENNVSPVCIETEISPAITVEAEARVRLGTQLRSNGRKILSCIAVRIPAAIAQYDGEPLREALRTSDAIEMVLHTGSSPTSSIRWPAAGWMKGTLVELSILVQSASLPPEVVEAAADDLVAGVSQVAGMLEEIATHHSGAIHQLSKELRQEDGAQTRRMAAAILANAFVFHGSLAGGPGDLANVKSIETLASQAGFLSKLAVLSEWEKILAINYWPIFDIARRLLLAVPAENSKEVIASLGVTAGKLLENRLMRSHDLTGAVFQKLIADRKFLAAYYTTPSSAALVAGLALNPEKPSTKSSWSDGAEVTSLRVADFACGTGTLLSAAYHRIGQLHEMAGGDSEAIHPAMMASALVGCDVLPAAAHLTASMLAGAHPTSKYTKSSILTVAYGKQSDGTVALGSLDLVDSQGRFDLLAPLAKAAEGLGEADRNTWASLPHETFDLVVMNPPFTRATGHHEIHKVGVPNPMFAAFSSDEEEQKLMSNATKQHFKDTSAHGNAGEASYFLVLAHRKLRENGMLGLVMPASLMLGNAWEKSRVDLRKKYRDLVVISISGAGGADVSFSADTDMAECVVVARKDLRGSNRGTFVVLQRPVGSTLVGENLAQQIRRAVDRSELRRMEDGPVGGTPIYFGDDEIGQIVDSPLPESGGWSLCRIADIAVGQTAFQLAEKGRIWLPGIPEKMAHKINIATVGGVGTLGPVHRDINGAASGGTLRGPFNVVPVKKGSVATYPVLWAHDADRERAMVFDHDTEGTPRKPTKKTPQADVDSKIAALVSNASHCHFNCDFRFNSQSTGMQFTPRRTIGGRAWLSIRLANQAQEKALVLWGNTTLGLLLHWWHSNKPQPGRGNIGKSTLETLPTLDVAKLTKEQLAAAVKLFNDIGKTEMLTCHQLDVDADRHVLDDRFCREVLGLPKSFTAKDGPLDLLRMKFAEEPSVNGNKADSSNFEADRSDDNSEDDE